MTMTYNLNLNPNCAFMPTYNGHGAKNEPTPEEQTKPKKEMGFGGDAVVEFALHHLGLGWLGFLFLTAKTAMQCTKNGEVYHENDDMVFDGLSIDPMNNIHRAGLTAHKSSDADLDAMRGSLRQGITDARKMEQQKKSQPKVKSYGNMVGMR